MTQKPRRRSRTPGFPKPTCIAVKSWCAAGAPNSPTRVSSCLCVCPPGSSHAGGRQGPAGKPVWLRFLKSQRPSHDGLLADISVKRTPARCADCVRLSKATVRICARTKSIQGQRGVGCIPAQRFAHSHGARRQFQLRRAHGCGKRFYLGHGIRFGERFGAFRLRGKAVVQSRLGAQETTPRYAVHTQGAVSSYRPGRSCAARHHCRFRARVRVVGFHQRCTKGLP